MADNDREELFQRFNNVIGQPFGSTYFEEEELLEIFDYAGDLNDNLVRMEVLLWGAKLYPGSLGLAERRGLLYYNLGEHEGAAKIIAKTPGESVLQRLLALRLEQPSKEGATEIMEGILNDTADFKDEEIIQLVQTASEAGLYPWLKERKTEIEGKCSFPQSFLYELVVASEDNNDFDYGVELIEELTELEPFNYEFWEMLGEFYNMHYEDGEKTLSAAEYALAINPDSYKALLLKAKALYDLHHSLKEIEPIMNRIMELGPDEEGPILLFSMIYDEWGEWPKGVKLITDYLDTHPADRVMIDALLLHSKGSVDYKYFRSYFESEHPDTATLIEWGREVLNTGLELKYSLGAVSIISLIPEEERKREYTELWIEAAFYLRQYDTLNIMFDQFAKDGIHLHSKKLQIIRVLCALTADMTEDTHDSADHTLQEMSEEMKNRVLLMIDSYLLSIKVEISIHYPTLTELLNFSGVVGVFKRIRDLVEKGERIRPESFLSFIIP